MAYIKKQHAREQAGFQKNEEKETPTGTANGSNKVFVTLNYPIVDSDYDDDVDTSDIIVYVNDVPVAVTSLVASSGTITLTNAPALSATVTVTYSWSKLPDTTVANYISMANGEINGIISGVYQLPLTADTHFSGSQGEDLIQSIEMTLSAGLLLTKEYGLEADGTNKIGRDMVKMAREQLDKIKSRELKIIGTDNAEIAESTDDDIVYDEYDSTKENSGEMFNLSDEMFKMTDPDDPLASSKRKNNQTEDDEDPWI